MSPAEWRRERIAELRARIRIEEAILRSLRAEMEEFQWLNRRATELRYGWDVALSAEDQERRASAALFELIWLLGEHALKRESPDVPAEALINASIDPAFYGCKSAYATRCWISTMLNFISEPSGQVEIQQ